MRHLTLLALVLGLVASAFALTPSTSNVYRPEQEPGGQEGENPPGRTQGDTVADPFFVSFDCEVFSASGNTCGYVNDYDYACPYTGSTSADVVYKFVCSSNMAVTIDLCASTYDTKLYVYANTVGNVIACNDDFCSFQSSVGNVPLAAGNTYYIVVDGYGGSCGNYELVISQYAPCVGLVPARRDAGGRAGLLRRLQRHLQRRLQRHPIPGVPDPRADGRGHHDLRHDGSLPVRHAALSRHGLVPDGHHADVATSA